MTFQFEQKMRCSSMAFCLIKTEFKLSVKRKSPISWCAWGPPYSLDLEAQPIEELAVVLQWGGGGTPGQGQGTPDPVTSRTAQMESVWQQSLAAQEAWVEGREQCCSKTQPPHGEGAAGLGSQLPGRCGKAPCDWVALMASPRASSVVSISTSSSCCLESLDLSSFSS